jgi:uncharacterized protein with HEPN domain
MGIIHACLDIISFTENIDFEQFKNNKLVRFAVERQLLVIGEAANHLSEKFIRSRSDIPWRQIIGLRNIIAHDYGEILVERIWYTVQKHIITLKIELSQYVD